MRRSCRPIAEETPACRAHCHSVEVFTRRFPPPEIMAALVDAGAPGRIYRGPRRGPLIGYRVAVNAPTLASLDVLQSMIASGEASLFRLDITLDFRGVPFAWARTLRLSRTRRRVTFHYDGTPDRPGRSIYAGRAEDRRVLIAYERPETGTLRVELRFRRAATLRRFGLDLPSLPDADPGAILRRHVRPVARAPGFVESVLRRTVRDDVRAHRRSRRSESPHVDRYRAGIAHRVRCMLDVPGHSMAAATFIEVPWPAFLPTSLEWPEAPRAVTTHDRGQSPGISQ